MEYIESLRIFRSVVELKSFTRAAEAVLAEAEAAMLQSAPR